MNADLELAKAVFPDGRWFDDTGMHYLCVAEHPGTPLVSFDPLGAHFADVLAWLSSHGAVEINTFGVVVTAEYDELADCEHDGTASGIKQAVYEAAKRAVMEGKE